VVTTTSVGEPLATSVMRPNKAAVVVVAATDVEEVVVASAEVVAVEAVVQKRKRGLEIGIVNTARLTISLDALSALNAMNLEATNRKLCFNN